ncbi:MAG: hypothetical protein MJ061_06430, partial [Mailhella sp.]|nr:hypothetical protein [Mailhella sp.]
SSFRLALEGLAVPPSVFGMIPGIPADTVKAVLPEGETLGFSLEGTVVPGRTSKAPSTLRAVLSGANLCDLGAETAFLLDADSFAELSEGGGLMALLGAADRISLTKASVSLTDRRALGLMLAVGAGMMQSKPSQLLPQAASMMQAMKPESPQNGMDRLLAEVIGAVQPVLATLGGLSVSLEFPTPVKASAPTIPDDVMVTTSVKEASRPVLETLPENLR